MFKAVVGNIIFVVFQFLATTTLVGTLHAQAFDKTSDFQESKLFASEDYLPVKLEYSLKDVRRKTNDSIYIKTHLVYKNNLDLWDSIPIRVRARGNFRKDNCYYTPVKLKIKKKHAKGTIFEGDKELKLVVPCQPYGNANDKILREYLAYKMYEIISPYHFKTRLLQMEFNHSDKKRAQSRTFWAFLIEDIDRVALRHQANKLKRYVHPLNQDNFCSLQVDLFQYMIGNTDFSNAYGHNSKLLFTSEKKCIPVPYDFDMSGLVNADYAVVSQIGDQQLNIENVTQRLYRGFKREDSLCQTVRNHFLAKRNDLLHILNAHQGQFENQSEFAEALQFTARFFDIIENNTSYEREILGKARDN